VELLLGYGGPTVTLRAELDETDYGYEVREIVYSHSWGNDIGKAATLEDRDDTNTDTVGRFLRLVAPDTMGEL